MTREESFRFEQSVRDLARAMWRSPAGAGAPEVHDGRERDCIFRQEFVTHYIEATTHRSLEYFKKCIPKMVTFRDQQARRGVLVQAWIVTREEPTGDQRSEGHKNSVRVLSFREFSRLLMDGTSYLHSRREYHFGSATNPASDSTRLDEIEYQPVGIRAENDGEVVAVGDLVERLKLQAVVLLLGDYGMGKSLAIYQIYKELQASYFRSEGVGPVPVAINLRDHWGQENPAEALARHASNIGFPNPEQLVRALHAGRLIVLLDGFDEIASQAWSARGGEGRSGPASGQRLKDLRRHAVTLVRNLADICRGRCGLLVAGREHFFDTRRELEGALSLRNHQTYWLSEFTEEEARKFLARLKVAERLPDWLPRRPLLLASLQARGFIKEVLEVSDEAEPAEGWNRLIKLICQREATIHKLLDDEGIRRILELLAASARSTAAGLGPITEDDLAEAFRSVMGAYPDEPARILLQRLPGLSLRNSQDGSRVFLDDQMLEVLRAGAVYSYLINPFVNPRAEEWVHGLGQLGVDSVSAAVSRSKVSVTEALLVNAAEQAVHRWSASTLAIDLLHVGRAVLDEEFLDFGGLTVEGGDCQELDLTFAPWPKRLALIECTINEVVLPNAELEDFRIEDCVVGSVVGCSSEEFLPVWIKGAAVEDFSQLATTAQIMDERGLPLALRVFLTVLRKIFVQRGAGRKEGALRRGISQEAQSLVDPVLALLESSGMIFSVRRKGITVWHGVAGQKSRALDILNTAASSSDKLVQEVRRIR
jgi:hypothetical protein